MTTMRNGSTECGEKDHLVKVPGGFLIYRSKVETGSWRMPLLVLHSAFVNKVSPAHHFLGSVRAGTKLKVPSSLMEQSVFESAADF